ncbi:MAG: DUF3135 domain-containing protein [Azonexus sp.]
MKSENDFFFEEWAFLARVDPEAFERRRRNLIAEFLAASPRQRALGEALQARIDLARGRAAEPLEALLVIAAMLRAELGRLAEKLHALYVVLDGPLVSEKPSAAAAPPLPVTRSSVDAGHAEH